MAAQEIVGSPTYAFDLGSGWSAVRKWRMPWGEAGQFLHDEINQILLPPPGGVGTMIAKGGTIKPWENVAAKESVDQPNMVYKFAVVTISYAFPSEVLIEIDGNNKKFSIQFQPNMEVISLDHEKFQWGNDDGPFTKLIPITAKQAPFVKFFTMDIVETRYEVALTDAQFSSGLFRFIGLSNDQNMFFKSVLFETGTLLYNAPTLISTGELWTITYRLSYRPQTWNRFYKEDQPEDARFISIWSIETPETPETPAKPPEKFRFAPPTANFTTLPR